MTREEAYAILVEYTKSQSLLRHALAVEAAMRHHATFLGGDPELWGITGLLHDFDYERWPEPPDHTRRGAEVLRERGVDAEIVDAMLSHADWNLDACPRDRPLRKALFAVDELCGFLTAVALVRPSKSLAEVDAKAVRKKLKDKAFARSVNRDDIRQGALEIGLSLEDHIALVRDAMATIAAALGLPPSS
jgi:putative nucleotidyltransferase with HDIG domain